ncbi:Sorting nexin 2B [Acorus gramineus]|uniref:Sorting nexin 2B n=1 Tax=Acorus gramineus TaxID=55184 RepID=A0AAV9AJN1_ACOGR|nr:Sorting nexin 2B [Acorus gramineus]
MMGEEPHPLAQRDDEIMESLVLDDDVDGDPSHLRFRSAMSSLSDAHHPLSSPPPPDSSSSYLDPPSYADVVFTPSDSLPDHSVSRSASSASGSVSHRRPSRLRISVSDPQKEQETANSLVPGGSTYVTYLITTRSDDPDFGGAGGGEISVRRRFRDVVTLADRLAESYRGYFVPARPDKSVVEGQVMQRQDFVEQRRSALEKYLRRLAEHPAIGRSEELRLFLTAQGKLPLPTTTDVASRVLDGAARLPKQIFGGGNGAAAAAGDSWLAPQEVTQPAKGGRDLMRMFKELRQSVANDWGGGRPPVAEEDKEFLERKERMQDLEAQLSNASQQAEALVKAQQDIGETMGELGLAFIKLTKFENEEALYNSQRIRAADAKNLATAAVKASRFYRESNAQTVKHLDTLHEYLGLMLSVHSAFSDRSSALLTVQTLLSELSSLHARAEKLEAASSKIFGGDKSRIRKLEEVKETIKITEDAKFCALREYERIKENNRSELERLDRERHDDMLNMLKGFVINQVGYAEKIANVWAKVAEETSGYVKEKEQI